MSALPLHSKPGPDDPAEILRLLPEQFHAEFRAEYVAAVEQAREPRKYRELQGLLRLWRMRALMYSDRRHEERRAAAQTAHSDDVSLEQLSVSRTQR